MEVQECPSGYFFNVFGLDTEKLCCYRYHKYCEEVEECPLKTKHKERKEKC